MICQIVNGMEVETEEKVEEPMPLAIERPKYFKEEWAEEAMSEERLAKIVTPAPSQASQQYQSTTIPDNVQSLFDQLEAKHGLRIHYPQDPNQRRYHQSKSKFVQKLIS